MLPALPARTHVEFITCTPARAAPMAAQFAIDQCFSLRLCGPSKTLRHCSPHFGRLQDPPKKTGYQVLVTQKRLPE
jgi:hypothetical protein